MQEIVQTAHASGIMLDVALIEHNISKTMTMGPYRSSMQIDRETGRAIELEAILGNPLRAAQRLGVSTPRLQMLYALLAMQEMELPPKCACIAPWKARWYLRIVET